MSDQIFSDITVVDLTWNISGPYCTKVFADYGAKVIKVEMPGVGDPGRSMEPFLDDDPNPDKSLLFSHLNLNKLGVTINLKTDAGIKLFLELVKNADILVESFSPGVMDRLGLGYENLKSINPHLVMTSISNFGQTGPYRDYKLSELVLNGFHSMINNGDPDRFPLKKGGNACLYQSGLIAALATQAALWTREDQGIGQYLDVSIMETQAGDADRKTVDLVSWAYSGSAIYTMRPEAENWRGTHIMPGGIFPCKDGFVACLPILPHWPRFVLLMKDIHPELEKIKFPEDMFDMDLKGEIEVMWYEWLSTRTRTEAMEESQAAKWFVTAVNSPADVVEDSHFKSHGFWVEVDHPVSGKQTYPGAPVQVGPESWKARFGAPMLGQHNEEVFSSLGYSHEMINDLKNQGAI